MCALDGVVMTCDHDGACTYTDTGEWAGRVLLLLVMSLAPPSLMGHARLASTVTRCWLSANLFVDQASGRGRTARCPRPARAGRRTAPAARTRCPRARFGSSA